MKIFLFLFLFLVLFLVSFSLYSSNCRDPVNFLEDILNEVKPKIAERDDVSLYNLLLRYVDFEEISIFITGKKIWFESNIDDRLSFIEQLQKLVFETYKKTAYHYIGFDFEFLRPSGYTLHLLNSRIQVSSILKRDGNIIVISYRMINKNDFWFIYDIIIDGVSVLKSLQLQYSSMIRLNGLKYAIDKMMMNKK